MRLLMAGGVLAAVLGGISANEVFAQGLINLPLTRQADGRGQIVAVSWYIFGQPHTGVGGGEHIGNSSDTQEGLAHREPLTGDTINSNGLIVFSHPVATANSSIGVGISSTAPSVNAYGRVATAVVVSHPQDDGRGWSNSTSSAIGIFRIVRHPTINTQGSQNNAWVTVRGRFSLIITGQNNGTPQATIAGRQFSVSLGGSSLVGDEAGPAGWSIAGTLQNSTRTTPTAPANNYATVTSSGVNITPIIFTQAARIGNNMEANADVTFPGNVQQTLPTPASNKSVGWNYSILASCSVEDVEVP